MNTWQIRIEGIVQGVGFRPFVYRLAREMGINGEVSNGLDGVRVCFNENKEQAQLFYEEILRNKPAISKITHSKLTQIDKRFFESFQIVESEAGTKKSVLFAPDYAMCSACRAELLDPADRRFGYPFITCTQCGPRFSIIEYLPYDREWTTMADFTMCEKCQAEYDSPLNRRHFSQTNSCQRCGIQLRLKGETGEIFSKQNLIIEKVIKAWKEGKIVAIKGIGGYLLTCDAQNEAALYELRSRKHRPAKPFAVMYPSIDALSAYQISEIERAELLSERSPVLLLRKKAGKKHLPDSVAPGLDEAGIMVPFAPLFEWLIHHYRQPIVATSANITHSPIIYQDEGEQALLEMADLVLGNDREISIPQDDSVVRFTPVHQQPIIIRRSRGMAPSYFYKGLQLPAKCILAFGADLKSAFTLLHEGNIYISQYLGDLSHFDTQLRFLAVQEHVREVLGSEPEMVLHDLHPEYASTHLATTFCEEYDVAHYAFQHHKAHFAAVLAENELMETDHVLGIIWDGTGYGDDGNIWGGEFFLWNKRKIVRQTHLAYFPVLAGDKMAMEPRLSAFSLLPAEALVRDKFSEGELKVYDKLHPLSKIQTSSMGRLFDAVASVLGLIDVQSYEGEAAMKLEAIARRFMDVQADYSRFYELENLDGSRLLQKMVKDLEKGISPAQIAATFHLSLVQLIRRIANNLKTKKIAMSGGVFQNALLVDLIIGHLGKDFQLYFHKQLSPNDENISFGQLMLYINEHRGA